MDDAVFAEVSGAIDGLLDARRLVADVFGVSSASSLVRRVLDGEIHRQGHFPNGLEYFVHGVGYTVVFDNGAQAHLDACDGDGGDCFTVYDARGFLQDTSERVPSLESVREVCDEWVARGQLGMSGEATYLVLDPGDEPPA
ncbi:DUF6896 domain-containing protein [Salinispora arenicola]|uniref:DUF6896 domain-containing protein n=1 Tax=Salinispora arenicola TaxID=168697 RepID=UPI0016A125AE|nr:hypothetical protein [Salinispora arenicola]NIL58212.1 hypothetical protein [Salinispora arenicola]NIL63659.1 hypothetical protein [Salinispora arenicola]